MSAPQKSTRQSYGQFSRRVSLSPLSVTPRSEQVRSRKVSMVGRSRRSSFTPLSMTPRPGAPCQF